MSRHDVQVEVMLSREPVLENESKEITDLFNPGGTIYGRVTTTSERNFRILSTSVYLEGTSRNWITSAPTNAILLDVLMAERKFLSQALDIDLSEIHPPEQSATGFTSSMEFHFVMSDQVPTASAGTPEHCLQLPPSIEMGHVMVDNRTRKRFAQPSISYAVRTLITFAGQSEGATRVVEVSVPLSILPYTAEFPPTDTERSPHEFKLRDSRQVRRWLFGRTIGSLEISLREPQPLYFDDYTHVGMTACLMELQLRPIGNVDDIAYALQDMKTAILPLLRIKTFYSLKTFPHLPDQKLLESNSHMDMRETTVRLERSNLARFSWGYCFDPPGIEGNETARIPPSESSPTLPSGVWKAKVSVPIRVNGPLIPNFCSSIVARVYSLSLRITVTGITREFYEMEVPIQIIHRSPNHLTSGDAGMFEDTSQLETSSVNTRLSESSWFSEESLRESCELPPQYHP